MPPANPIGLSSFSDPASRKLIENLLSYDAKKAAEREKLREQALIHLYI